MSEGFSNVFGSFGLILKASEALVIRNSLLTGSNIKRHGGLTGSPGGIQKKKQEDQLRMNERRGDPLADLRLPGSPGLPSGSLWIPGCLARPSKGLFPVLPGLLGSSLAFLLAHCGSLAFLLAHCGSLAFFWLIVDPGLL